MPAEKYEQFIQNLDDSLGNDPAGVCRQVDSLLSVLGDSVLYYRGVIVKAKSCMFVSETDSAVQLLRKAERFCATGKVAEKRLWELYANICNMKGNIFARRTMMDSARTEFYRAFRYCVRIGDRQKMYDVSLNLADAYVRSGQYDKGSLWYRRALSYADSLRLPDESRFPAYYGLAQVYMELRDFSQCDFYYDRAECHYDHMKPYEKHVYLNNRGNSYYYRQEYPTALEYFRRSLALANKFPEMEFERNLTMVNLGEVFMLMNRTDSASYYLNRCRRFFREMHNNSALYYIDTQLVELALKENNLILARKRLKEAVRPAYVEPNMVHIRNRYLQHYFEQAGDFRQAYYYQRENQRIDDSTRNERIRMRSAEIDLKYRQDSTLMKKEILIQQKQNEVLRLSQWLYRGGFVVLLVAAGAGAWLLFRKKKRDEADRTMRTAIASLRLENIRNRISPHFIFNVLSREVNLHRAEDNGNLLGLIKLMRRNLELADSLSVKLADELDFVKTYIDLEKQTLQPDFEYHLDIDGEVDLQKVKVPAMLLQIPVENAVKHALRLKQGKRCLWVHVKNRGAYIEATVCDNGGGYRGASDSKGTGTGMKVITRTLQLLNTYNAKPLLMTINNVPIEGGETGCKVSFTIPFGYSYQLKRKKTKMLWKKDTRQSS